MPYQNGVFSRLFRWAAIAAGGASNDTSHADSYDDDIATSLNQCLLRDGTGSPTADIPFNNHSLTSIRQGAAAGEAVEYAQWQNSLATRLVGEIIDYGGSAAPSKWLMCDGRLVSRTTYALLFAAVGTTFGAGDGSTTFALPDLRGRATFGGDAMAGANAAGGTAAGRVTTAVSGIAGATIGAVGGDQNLQAHTHNAGLPSGYYPEFTGNNSGYTVMGSGSVGVSQVSLGQVVTATTGAGASQNMPPALVVAKIIYAGA